jgi:3'-phosphoadenosine 5'-phosphosulfate sulfotransferase (PAPS reductase)/FAD synthetase
MQFQDKINHATALLRYFPEPRALMCSFGKDSMVLLHLIREVLPRTELLAHSYPVQVLYHRHPWFPVKHEFADSIIRSWNLEVHDYLPVACGVKTKEDMIELVARYQFGNSVMDLPVNIEEPGNRREYACGLQWILRPKATAMTWNWKTVFIGHKSSDVDPFEGHVPLKHDAAKVGNINLVFPLRHWTDDDVWDYIEKNNVPYDKRRYAGRLEVPDHWLNPDYLHACTRCVDPRTTSADVMCPKLNRMISNVGDKVLRLDSRPQYVKEKEYVGMDA